VLDWATSSFSSSWFLEIVECFLYLAGCSLPSQRMLSLIELRVEERGRSLHARGTAAGIRNPACQLPGPEISGYCALVTSYASESEA